MSAGSPLLRSPPPWHTEEPRGGQSSCHRSNTFLEQTNRKESTPPPHGKERNCLKGAWMFI